MNYFEKVRDLIKTTKRRLFKEYIETKEAIALLKKSFKTKLTTEEKKVLKKQLPDVIKVLIAFFIFLLPLGAVWLLIYMKLFPKMLPSAFVENDKLQ